ncbi:MAG: hypothetical protein WD534_17105 [Phycisphaeraceae bacterium]
MPPAPLVTSPRRQRQLVAVLMCIVFVASIGVAYLFSEARISRGQVTFRAVQIGRLQLQVPDHWQRDTVAEQAMGMEGLRLYRSPDRPHQALRVLRVRQMPPEPAGEMVNRAMPVLLTPDELQTFQPLTGQVPAPGSALQLVEVAGISQLGPEPTDVRIHLVAAMTVEGIEHWVLHLADRPGADERPGRVLEHNLALFREIERSAGIGPPEASDADEAASDADASEPAAGE